jgi:AAA family ATP:ADP antiporter|tara:strand:+ start:3883 stop:5154 length:1272 start_codon:yes stop_codon:yes gene_type:complete
MERNLISFLPRIEKNEKIILLRAFLFFFFVLASWYALRPVRNELAVQGGIYNLPWLLMGVMLAMLIINPIYSWLVSRINQNRLILYIYSFFIINLILFLILWTFAGDEGRIWTGRAFYIWANVYSFFVVSIFWVTMINFFSHTDSKKFFGIISAGGSLGAFFGSTVARYFSTEICGNTSISDLGPMSLIIFSIFSLLFAIYFSRTFKPRIVDHENSSQELGGSSFEAIQNIIKDPAIRNIGLYVILFTMLMTTSWMISLGIVQEWSQDPCERTGFFARIEQIVTPLTLLMQLFLASYILRRVGSLTVLSIYGVLFAIAFMAYAFYPTITTVMMVVISLRIFEYGLNKPTRESIYTKLKQQDRYKSTVFIDTFLARSGDVIGGWFVRGLVGTGIAVLSVTWAALPFALFISYMGFQVNKAVKDE